MLDSITLQGMIQETAAQYEDVLKVYHPDALEVGFDDAGDPRETG